MASNRILKYGCENEVSNGVVANQYGSWPYGRAGWCAGQDVKQWSHDITSWVDMNGQVNELTYRGLFNGQEYNPTGETNKGGQKHRSRDMGCLLHNSTI